MAVASLALAAFLLLQAARAQQVGTVREEEHPPLPIAQCTRELGCSMEHGEVTLDSQWRWAHDGNMNGCFIDGTWSAALCSDPMTCANQCQLEGLGLDDYAKTYGVSQVPGGLKMDFAVPGGSVGSRLYLMADADNFKMFNLKNREFTFDVDVSALPCGLNGAVYFVEMEVSGNRNGASNKAGAKYGTGYCDAQCPKDLKFINGAANVLDWNDTSSTGRYGACCSEMDLWEANREASAYTVHPCTSEGLEKCDWMRSDCKGVCDTAGCDFNSYRMGDRSFYGPGPSFDVDTTSPMTVVTQFITDDGTDAGELVEIRRLYVQNGEIVHNSAASALGEHGGHSITKDFCDTQKKAFDNPNNFDRMGGLKQMGEAMDRGMVLVLSVWDDDATGMTWLDATSPKGAKVSKPGVQRGPCSPHSGHDKELRQNHPGAAVVYSNFAYGEIDSTYGKDSQKAKEQEKIMTGDFCCLAAPNPNDFCGTCFSSATAPSNTFCGQSETYCRSCGEHSTWCPATAKQAPVQQAAQQVNTFTGDDSGEVALTLEGMNVPPGLVKGDMVTLSLGGKEMQVQVVGLPRAIAAVHATTTTKPGGLWGFLPVLQRSDADAKVSGGEGGRGRYGAVAGASLVFVALVAATSLAVAAARVHRRSAGDGRGTPLVLRGGDEEVPSSPVKQLRFESPRRRRPDPTSPSSTLA